MTQNYPCLNCGTYFSINSRTLAFYERVSPAFGGIKFPIPPPKLCPSCRLQRRFAFRNPIYVYLIPSSVSGKQIFSMYTDNVPFPVVEKEHWWSDNFDPLSYGRDFDFSRPFFEQFKELCHQVPHFPLSVLNMENSDYCNNAGGCKNCYFVFNATDAEDCMYCDHIWYSRDCLECTSVQRSELCYDCVYCHSCYNLQSSWYCDNCSDSFFLRHCQGCRHCFSCTNLRRAEYCAFNRQLSKGEYLSFVAKQDLRSRTGRTALAQKFKELSQAQPAPHLVARMTEYCSGNLLSECRNVSDSFHITGAENVAFGYLLYDGIRECQDYSMFGLRAELLYECCVCGIDAYNLQFCFDCWDNVSNLLYCMLCVSSKDLFGCVGLRKKQYCVMNKQYSEGEYNRLVPKIIEHMQKYGEWGEFFPKSSSPIPYNRSLAQRYFPCSRQAIEKDGSLYYEPEYPSAGEAISPDAIPDTLPKDDSPLIAFSAISGKPFKITNQEIKKLRKFSGVLPTQAYDERMSYRDKLRGNITLSERHCAKSGNSIVTAYDHELFPLLWDKDIYDSEYGS